MKVPPAKVSFPEEDRRTILAQIEECLLSGRLTLGERVREFEEGFKELLRVRYAVAVNSGTSALEIPLRILGVAGKEVLVPTNTFFATPAAVLHAGGRVRFVETDPDTFSLDVESLEQQVTEQTVGVIVVHVGGIISHRIGDIHNICRRHHLFLLEDAAHAHGSCLNGRMAGTFGDVAAFSFYPTKVITSGEGGMIVTQDHRLRDEAVVYRDQGKVSFSTNIHERLGYNWRMSEVHAILGLAQLRRLSQFIEARARIAQIYNEGLKAIPNLTPLTPTEGCRSNYYKYIVVLPRGLDRCRLKRLLSDRYGVGLSGEVYAQPCHLQPIFRDSCGVGDFPVAEDLCARHICLPVFPTMTTDQAEYVLFALREALNHL